MVAECMTKHKGIWYLPGEIIPEEPAMEEQPDDEPVYTKTAIKRMPIDELKKLASEKGIEDAENATGEQLKDALIAMMGL
nr:MAG TPA: Rho termination factor, N-terminal domain [Caudoviricetes sp.]